MARLASSAAASPLFQSASKASCSQPSWSLGVAGGPGELRHLPRGLRKLGERRFFCLATCGSSTFSAAAWWPARVSASARSSVTSRSFGRRAAACSKGSTADAGCADRLEVQLADAHEEGGAGERVGGARGFVTEELGESSVRLGHQVQALEAFDDAPVPWRGATQLGERGQRGARLAGLIGGVGDGEGKLDPRFAALALEELRRHLDDPGPAFGLGLEGEELPEGGQIVGPARGPALEHGAQPLEVSDLLEDGDQSGEGLPLDIPLPGVVEHLPGVARARPLNPGR